LAIPSPEFEKGIVAAYAAAHRGLSLDHVLADPELDAAFLAACKKSGLEGVPSQWNRALLRVRKAGRLPGMTAKRPGPTAAQMDAYSFAAEIAMQQLNVDCDASLDDVLCDPRLAGELDHLAAQFAPGFKPFEYRWAALALRKRAKQAKRQAVEQAEDLGGIRLPVAKSLEAAQAADCDAAGVYVLCGSSRQPLYVGETLDLKARLERLGGVAAWDRLGVSSVRLIGEKTRRYALQSLLIHRLRPLMNSQLLCPKL
jgi:site-specific DNA-methyltransferase (adenine-specific)